VGVVKAHGAGENILGEGREARALLNGVGLDCGIVELVDAENETPRKLEFI
jgi:hypothetical protein